MEGGEVHALKDVNFTLDAGDMIVILGPSGSGKSTLLSLLGGLSSPTTGRVHYKGHSLYDMRPDRLAHLRNREFGFIFQFHLLMPDLTALENVMLPGRIRRRGESECRTRAERLLVQAGLKDRMLHKPGELSGGEQQRVAVARALMNEPELILADEPTGNLDVKTAEGIHDILWELCQKEAKTLVVVTHYEPLAKRADHILHLEQGQVTKRRN
jgi:lipoprotein-releasing system ATP-binding protein